MTVLFRILTVGATPCGCPLIVSVSGRVSTGAYPYFAGFAPLRETSTLIFNNAHYAVL